MDTNEGSRPEVGEESAPRSTAQRPNLLPGFPASPASSKAEPEQTTVDTTASPRRDSLQTYINDDGLKTPTSQVPSSLQSLVSLDKLTQHHSGEASGGSPAAETPTTQIKHAGKNDSASPSRRPSEAATGNQAVAGPSTGSDAAHPHRPRNGPFPLDNEAGDKPKDDSTDTIVSPDQPDSTSGPSSDIDLQSLPQGGRRPARSEASDSDFTPLPHSLRARAASPQQTHQHHRSNASSASDLGLMSFGAKMAGLSPAPSPVPFSPTSAAKRSAADVEAGQHSASLHHSIHLQAPKETHKLWKDIDPQTGRKTINNYELLKKLGSGQHGTVKLGKNLENGDQVAVKIVRRFSKKVRLGKTGGPNDMIKKEVAILKKARHEHVVSLYEVIDDEEFSKVYLILEYVERGEIVWRKPTEKIIAMFEREHVEKAKAGPFDEKIFRAAVDEFNVGLPARLAERTRRLEERRLRKQQSPDELSSRRKFSIADPQWAFENYGEGEVEWPPSAYHQHHRVESETRLSRADAYAAETAKQSPQGGTPAQTPTSHPFAHGFGRYSISQPNSRPDSPTVLEGSAYGGGLSEDGKRSDLDLQSAADEDFDDEGEWTDDEENYRFVPCLTLAQAMDIFRDTVLGLEYLHYQGIMHRDIKPANLLWTHDYRVKISDFGVSYLGKPIGEDAHPDDSDADAAPVVEDVELAKTVGTPAFYAPELCDPDFFDSDKQTQRPAITGQIDVWALGVTLYGMIFGRLPFYHANEFKMYEKIARDELYIPYMRLRGVEHKDETPSNHNKRMDDYLDYEDVDDTLRDLLKRLLAKNPSDRITIKEVKHHPWVIRGIEDMNAWLDQTDPSRLSEGKIIKPSDEEIKDAVVGVFPMLDRFRTNVQGSLQRLGSVFRGRSSRKRTESNPKIPDSPASSISRQPRDDRRASLRGDEQIFSALKASREAPEHPLAHSVAASPDHQAIPSPYFPDVATTAAADSHEHYELRRAPASDHAMSTADSVKTIRALPSPQATKEVRSVPSTSAGNVEFSTNTTALVEPPTPGSGISHILGAPGRFIGSMRNRERGTDRSTPSQSSRSSSIEPSSSREELHAHPSLAVSSAVAAGHVDQPPALREEGEYPVSSAQVSGAGLVSEMGKTTMWENPTGTIRPGIHRRSISLHLGDASSPLSPADEAAFAQPRPASAAESVSGFPAISSSSDMLASEASAAHSRIPSVVSGASSLSVAPADEEIRKLFQQPSKDNIINPPLTANERILAIHSTAGSTVPSTTTEKSPTGGGSKMSPHEDVGYSGDPEDSESDDDEGLTMPGAKK